MNTNDSHPMSPSASGSGTPRRSLLRHHEIKREREQPEASPDEVDSPSASSLKAAMVRANAQDENTAPMSPNPLDLSDASDSDANARSSLPLALARANESRKLPPKPLEEPEEENREAGEALSVTDFFLRFGTFSNAIHPLRGWGVFSVFYLLSAVLLGHPLTLWCQMCHPCPRRIVDGASFWAGHLGRSFGLGVGLTILLSLLAWTIYAIGKGSPPFLWVFKITVYAVAPLILARFYLLLDLYDVGLEAYFRGYRPETWLVSSPLLLTAAGIWSVVRFLQSGASQHCQAKPGRMFLPSMILLLSGLGALWGHTAIMEASGRSTLEAELAEAEDLFMEVNPLARAAVERLSERQTYSWSHALKVRFYLLRGELFFTEGKIREGREDMIRLVRMHPQGHPVAAFGRGVNLLAMGQVEDAARLLEAVNRVTDSEFLSCGRWLYHIRSGQYGEDVVDRAQAERIARHLQMTSPNVRHLEMSLHALFETGQNRRLLRELTEAERMSIPFQAEAALLGAIAAEREGRVDLAEKWWLQALSDRPSLADDARAADLRARFTSHP